MRVRTNSVNGIDVSRLMIRADVIYITNRLIFERIEVQYESNFRLAIVILETEG